MSDLSIYKQAGVDINQAENLVNWLQKDKDDPSSKGLHLSGIGGFASLYKADFSKYHSPILASSTDGVGTKVLLALENDFLDHIGIDLVAMCVNDLYTVGADPLFFLDYYASGRINSRHFKSIISSIKRGLKTCGASLLGGETAEMPGLYSGNHLDLAGFVVGLVDEHLLLNKSLVKENDILIGLPSNGFHSNGYSLIRKWLKDKPASSDVIKKLLSPTKIYSEIPQLCSEFSLKGLRSFAHITGGGVPGNLSRILPDHLSATISFSELQTPPWMKKFILSNTDQIKDVVDVFNFGVGMIACISKDIKDDFLYFLSEFNAKGFEIGVIKKRIGSSRPVTIEWGE